MLPLTNVRNTIQSLSYLRSYPLRQRLAAPAACLARILPPEILLRIFWEVVPLRHEHDPSIVPGPNSSWMRILRTKKALTLVSRSWHGPAMEVLYADIVLRRMHQVALLAQSLRSSQNDHTGLIRALSLDSCVFTQLEEVTRAPDALAFIFSSCRRLGSFSYRSDPVLLLHFYNFNALWILHPLRLSLETSANNLGRLRDLELGIKNIPEGNMPPHASFIECHGLLRIATGLVSLKLGHYVCRTDVESLRGQALTLPSLQDLQLSTALDAHHFTSYVVDTWSMPRLTSLTATHCSQFPTSLLVMHGRRLRYLHMYKGPIAAPSVEFDGDPLRHLASLCPKLEHLILPSPPAKPIALQNNLLRYLDIWHAGPEDDPAWEMKYLHREGSSLPSLRSVRLLLIVRSTRWPWPWPLERRTSGSTDWPRICHPELLAGKPDGVLCHRISGSWVVQTASVVAPEFMGTKLPTDAEDQDEEEGEDEDEGEDGGEDGWVVQPDAGMLAAVLEEQGLGPEAADAKYGYALDVSGQSRSDSESVGSSEWWDDEDSVESSDGGGSDEGMHADEDKDGH